MEKSQNMDQDRAVFMKGSQNCMGNGERHLTQKERRRYCDKKDILFQPAFEVKAIDTTAAGDTYSGYFLADLAGGKNISDALKDASLAASICVTRKGAAPSIPYKKEIENLI